MAKVRRHHKLDQHTLQRFGFTKKSGCWLEKSQEVAINTLGLSRACMNKSGTMQSPTVLDRVRARIARTWSEKVLQHLIVLKMVVKEDQVIFPTAHDPKGNRVNVHFCEGI